VRIGGVQRLGRGAWHSPDQVEYLVFSDSLVEEPGSSPWAPQPIAGAVAEFDQEEVSAVLEALDDAGNAFAALPGTGPADVDDFERGRRQLRRIVLARNSVESEAPTACREYPLTSMRVADGAPQDDKASRRRQRQRLTLMPLTARGSRYGDRP
jgi:hypothetical protein